MSTGVIGHHLPMDNIRTALFPPSTISNEGGHSARVRIKTTDTSPKEIAFQIAIEGKTVHGRGMCKGSACPSEHARCSRNRDRRAGRPDVLQTAQTEATEKSFNMVHRRRDTAPTTQCFYSQRPGKEPRIPDDRQRSLRRVSRRVAARRHWRCQRMIVRTRGCNEAGRDHRARRERFRRSQARRQVIAHSPLVRREVRPGCANWGRVRCAAGYAV